MPENPHRDQGPEHELLRVQLATMPRSRCGCGKLVLSRGRDWGSIGVHCTRGRALLRTHARTA